MLMSGVILRVQGWRRQRAEVLARDGVLGHMEVLVEGRHCWRDKWCEDHLRGVL